MRSLRLFIALIILALTNVQVKASEQDIDRPGFYAALRSSNEQLINEQTSKLGKIKGANVSAFQGALLMKKAGFMKEPGEKLKVFKAGREKLEAVINNDLNNTEFRFLRLIIQENSPKALGYNNNLEEDRSFILKSYSQLPEFLKKEILLYCKKSKLITPEDLRKNE